MYAFKLSKAGVAISLVVLEIIISSCECVPVYYSAENTGGDEEICKNKNVEQIANSDGVNSVERSARFLNFRKYFHKHPENSFKHFYHIRNLDKSGLGFDTLPSYYSHKPHAFDFSHKHHHGPWYNNQPEDDCDHDFDGPYENPENSRDNDVNAVTSTPSKATNAINSATSTESPVTPQTTDAVNSATSTESPVTNLINSITNTTPQAKDAVNSATSTESPVTNLINAITNTTPQATVAVNTATSTATTTKVPKIDIRFADTEENDEEKSRIYFPGDEY